MFHPRTAIWPTPDYERLRFKLQLSNGKRKIVMGHGSSVVSNFNFFMCHRLGKDKAMYEKEIVAQVKKIESMKQSGADEYDIKKQVTFQSILTVFLNRCCTYLDRST